MRFEIVFYTTEDGRSPIDEFLDELQRSRPWLYAVTQGAVGKLEDGRNHGEPLTKAVGDGLYELRVGGKDAVRILWFFMVGAKIVLVHGTVKKTKRLPEADREKALSRRADYMRRHAPGRQR